MIWNRITPQDAEATHRVATIERAISHFLVSQESSAYCVLYRMVEGGLCRVDCPIYDAFVRQERLRRHPVIQAVELFTQAAFNASVREEQGHDQRRVPGLGLLIDLLTKLLSRSVSDRIVEALGRGLKVPVVSIKPEETEAHFG